MDAFIRVPAEAGVVERFDIPVRGHDESRFDQVEGDQEAAGRSSDLKARPEIERHRRLDAGILRFIVLVAGVSRCGSLW